MPFKFKMKKTSEKTEKYLSNAPRILSVKTINEIAKQAAKKFIDASPSENIATHWGYEIEEDKSGIKLYFTNDYIEHGINIAVMVDTGHATKTGSWVSGQNYLPKATQEAFEQIIKETWEALKNYERHR